MYVGRGLAVNDIRGVRRAKTKAALAFGEELDERDTSARVRAPKELGESM